MTSTFSNVFSFYLSFCCVLLFLLWKCLRTKPLFRTEIYFINIACQKQIHIHVDCLGFNEEIYPVQDREAVVCSVVGSV